MPGSMLGRMLLQATLEDEMSIKNELDAIEVIGRSATVGGGFEEKDVKRLVTYFKSKLFKCTAGVAHGEVNDYWVGSYMPPSDSPIEFFPKGKFPESQRQIGSAIVVHPVRVPVPAPALQSHALLFANLAAGPKVVITAPLFGCTFAIGIADNSYVMSHAQAVSGENGIVLAQAIHGMAQKFLGITTTSTFLIHPGDTIDGRSGIGYGDPKGNYKANVVGFVVKHTSLPGPIVTHSLCFIVVFTAGDNKKIEKVVVVLHKGSKWEVVEIKK